MSGDPAPTDPGGWVVDVESLRLVGVHFDRPQLELLERAMTHPCMALAVSVLQDPVHIGVQLPLFTMDDQDDLGLLLRPCLVDIRTEWGVGDDDDEPWWRFPTLAGRELEQGYMGDRQLSGITPYRLWNLWPINPWDADVLFHEIALWKAEVQDVVMDTYGVLNGEIDPCDLLETDRRSHTHEHDLERVDLWQCVQGARELESRIKELFRRDEGGELVPLPVPAPRFSGGYDEVWSELVRTSHANSFLAMNSFLSRARDDILRTERHYSPWLWLS